MEPTNKNINRHSRAFSALLIVFILAFSLAPKVSHANDFTDSIKAMGASVASMASFLAHPIDSSLLAIVGFVTFLLNIAETVFGWIADPAIFTAIMNTSEIYLMWSTIRDLLNFVFIMVLLFSAFATVFQIDKYNYRKIVFHLILMALLVNFSFPITRFIMDVANVLMYELANRMHSAGSIVEIIKMSGMDTMIKGGDTIYLLTAIVFIFTLAATLLTIGIILLIRVVTLAIYLIFSPIAYVGSVLPGSKLNDAANEWWSGFMKQCFAGPTMFIMLYVAVELEKVITTSKVAKAITDPLKAQAVLHTASIIDMPKLVTSATLSLIPVIILWIGIGLAQKSGAIGAETAIGKSKKFLTATGKKLSGADWAKRNYDAFSAERKQRQADINKTSIGKSLGGRANRAQDKLWELSHIPVASKNARTRNMRDDHKKFQEANTDLDLANKGINDLNKIVKSGNKHQKAAAIQELIGRGSYDMSDQTNRTAYQNMRDDFGTDSQTFNAINNKLKASDPVSAFAHIKNDKERQDRIKEYTNSNQFDASKLGSSAFKGPEGQTLLKTLFEDGNINNSTLEKMREKGPSAVRNMKEALKTIGGDAAFNVQNIQAERDSKVKDSDEWIKLDDKLSAAKNVHTAHYAQHGDFHDSIKDQTDPDQTATRAALIEKFNEDAFKRTSQATMAAHTEEFAKNMNSAKFKSIVQKMEDGSAQSDFVDFARTGTITSTLPPGATPAQIKQARAQAKTFTANQNLATRDPYLSSLQP